MSALHCPYCGVESAVAEGGGSFVCPSCGKAIEPPSAGAAPPPKQRGGDRWSAGPPEESANRWSSQAPLGDGSSSSESVSQSSILPEGAADEPALVRPPTPPLLWALLALVVFLSALIGVIVLARSIRPWFTARRAAAQRATVEFWLPRLTSANAQTREEAARALVAMGPASLCRGLDYISSDEGEKKDFPVARSAVRAFASVGAEAAPCLRQAIDAPEPKLRAVAIEVLEEMGGAARAARDALLAALDDPNRWVRYHAIDALGYLGAGGGPATKRLAALVGGPDAEARPHAVAALGHIGPEARDAVAALQGAAGGSDPALSDLASKALKQIEVERLAREACRAATGQTRQWLKALQDDDAAAAVAAAEALGKLGFAGQSAAPGLALMLRHADPRRRLAAAQALGGLGLANAGFTPMLQVAARDEEAEVRAAAAKALETPPKPMQNPE